MLESCEFVIACGRDLKSLNFLLLDFYSKLHRRDNYEFCVNILSFYVDSNPLNIRQLS